ncbi:hypothetical protein AAFC00_004807 [Neodothiora populina]
MSKPSPPRHGYHMSDPGQFMKTKAPPVQAIHRPVSPLPLSPPVFSAPDLIEPRSRRSPSLGARSPGTLQFPRSAQLKPLDLGNPFYHRPNNGTRRRATLPTLNVTQTNTATIGTALGSPPDSGMGDMGTGTYADVPESEIGLAITSTPLAEKRRSRSANDLSEAILQRPSTRNRSEEIKFWRESCAGTVLLNPDTPSRAPADAEIADDSFDADDTVAHGDDDAHAASAKFLGHAVAGQRAVSEGKASSPILGASRPVTAGADRSEDLERRVANLESSLFEFQSSLERLTAGSRTNTLSPPSDIHRARRQHTPSVLIDTLQDPSWRPASLPGSPDHATYEDGINIPDRSWNDSSASYNLSGSPYPRPRTSSGTVRQLYDVLAEERAARQLLEGQLHDLQREVTTMATRLERGSWNSYSAPPLGFPLHHRPRTPDESVRGASSHSGAYEPRMISRFSGSDSIVESEIYGLSDSRQSQLTSRPVEEEREEEEMQTPYETYRTPLEERGPLSYRSDEDMF